MGYKRDKERKKIELGFDFESEREVSSIVEELSSVKIKYQEKFGDLFISCMLEEKRVGYEDWYFVISVHYWESETDYNNRIAIEKAKEEKDRQLQEAKRKKEEHNQAIRDEIKRLQSKLKK